jgi:hypothetical protein
MRERERECVCVCVRESRDPVSADLFRQPFLATHLVSKLGLVWPGASRLTLHRSCWRLRDVRLQQGHEKDQCSRPSRRPTLPPSGTQHRGQRSWLRGQSAHRSTTLSGSRSRSTSRRCVAGLFLPRRSLSLILPLTVVQCRVRSTPYISTTRSTHTLTSRIAAGTDRADRVPQAQEECLNPLLNPATRKCDG